MRSDKRLSLNLTDEQLNLIKQAAKKEKFNTPAAFAKAKLFESLQDEELDEDRITAVADKPYCSNIKLTREDAEILKQKSSAMGLTGAAYIRKLLHTRDFINYEIKHDDLDEFAEVVGSTLQQIDALAAKLRKQNYGFTPEDIIELKNQSKNNTVLINNILHKVHSNRDRVFREMVKEAKKVSRSAKNK